MRWFIPAVVFAIVCGCSSTQLDGNGSRYLPDNKLLTNRAVYKYYVHGTPKEGFPHTDIKYERIIPITATEYEVQVFNPGLELSVTRRFRISESSIELIEEKWYVGADTLEAKIEQNQFLNFAKDAEAHIDVFIKHQGRSQHAKISKRFLKDTTIFEKPAVIFEERQEVSDITSADTTKRTSTGVVVYAEKMGYVFGTRVRPDFKFKTELVEQIDGQEFDRMLSNRVKRIAYIDPSQTLDKNSTFHPCGIDTEIHDYYNSSLQSEFSAGKKEMTKVILNKVDKAKLNNESGYLTFRFVVNCHGEIGRFVTEESTLDFDKKSFNKQTVQHLYSIVSSLRGWRPVVLDNAKDAYIYVTFKMNNGEIIDILP